eukprot:10807_1
MGSETSFELPNKIKKFLPSSKVSCNGIRDCGYLTRLQKSMLESEYRMSDITNDFTHLLQSHDNDESTDFEYIYTALGGICDINNCRMFQRNYLERNRNTKPSTSTPNDLTEWQQQIIDKIHCFFCHSYDIGHRLTSREKWIIKMISETQPKKKWTTDVLQYDLNKALVNKQLIKMREILKSRTPINGISLTRNDKYNQLGQFSCVKDKENENKEEKENSSKFYGFGVQFWYKNDEQKHQQDSIHKPSNIIIPNPKYSSLKQELISNKISVITATQFNNEYAKMQLLFNSTYKKQNFEKTFSMNHLLSLMIYCNFDALQREFSKTYYDEKCIPNHDSFYHFGSFLKAAVNDHGSWMGSTYYHGIGVPVVFRQLCSEITGGIKIFSPLSTSTSLEVAISFTNYNKGVVMYFADISDFQIGGTKRFSLSWISDYPNEHEQLLVQNCRPLEIMNILYIPEVIEFGPILKALYVIQAVTTWMDSHKQKYPLLHINSSDGAERGYDATMMNVLVTAIVHNQLSHAFPETYRTWQSLNDYARQLINAYFQNKHYLTVHLHENKDNIRFLFKLICHDDFEWIRLDLLQVLFPNVHTIGVEDIQVSSFILEDILLCLKKESNVLVISIGATNKVDELQVFISKYKSRFQHIGFEIEMGKHNKSGLGWPHFHITSVQFDSKQLDIARERNRNMTQL